MAHIAGWEANATVRVPKVVAGAPRGEYDDDAFNEAVITTLGDQSFETVRVMLRRAYQRDVEMLETLDDALFVPGSFAYDHAKAAIDHCLKHTVKLAGLSLEMNFLYQRISKLTLFDI